MTTKATPPSPVSIASIRALPGGSRLHFAGWTDRAFGAIFDAALEVLAAHPGAAKDDAERLAHRAWDAGRSTPVGAHGEPLDLVLSREPRCSGAVLEIAELIRVLVGSGDVQMTLLAQRRQLDAAIEQIAQLRARKA